MPEPKPTLSPEAEAFLDKWSIAASESTYRDVRCALAALLATERRAAWGEAATFLIEKGEQRLSRAADSYTEYFAACLLKAIGAALREKAADA